MDENKVAEPEAPVPAKKKPTLLENIYDWFEVVCVAAVIVVLIFTFVGRMATVNGTSMTDTLAHGDRLIVTNLFYSAPASCARREPAGSGTADLRR